MAGGALVRLSAGSWAELLAAVLVGELEARFDTATAVVVAVE